MGNISPDSTANCRLGRLHWQDGRVVPSASTHGDPEITQSLNAGKLHVEQQFLMLFGMSASSSAMSSDVCPECPESANALSAYPSLPVAHMCSHVWQVSLLLQHLFSIIHRICAACPGR